MEQMTIRVIEIRKALQSLLLSIHDEVYYEEAPDNAVYPYIVYNLADSNDEDSVEQIMLEVDAWDTPINNNTIPLETLVGNVDNLLNRKIISVKGVFFSIYRENRRNVPDSDKRIRRRQYEYQIRVMGE